MNILFLHGVSAFGGSTKSLLELYTQLKQHGVQGTVVCPSGKSEKALSGAGMKTIRALGLTQFDNTLYGHYRGLRWLILLRELLFLIPTLFALLRVKYTAKQFDAIHANEITLLPLAILTKKLFKCPLVVHVRSVQRGSSNDWRSQILFKMLKKHANTVIAIDETVKASLPDLVEVQVIHNGINLSDKVRLLNERVMPEVPAVGIIGALLRLKGVYEFLEAARILVNERGHKVQFIVVGENARSSKGLVAWIYRCLGFSDDVMADMLQFIAAHNLQHAVKVRGFVQDVRTVYSELDILCFPSYLNAAGRPVFEAALFGIPSIVAIREPQSDTIINKVTGLCIDHPDPLVLADAIETLVKNPQERIQLGNNAQALAVNNFDITKNAILVVEIYRALQQEAKLLLSSRA
ncbi:glycosyltransferase family 4 protein [Legionella fallonii]|uniref:Glycosyl transferase protein n=1 Tax=Legionella fallonii LLAP-10 TaxID=1212491 RepID=A0A098G198_9GAMM|nr:glycosyltransferase family 4 protein [Legionella fallonii]CEG56253.1 Glycosyl transferase protein [Legionella fallonii LLAP-10]